MMCNFSVSILLHIFSELTNFNILILKIRNEGMLYGFYRTCQPWTSYYCCFKRKSIWWWVSLRSTNIIYTFCHSESLLNIISCFTGQACQLHCGATTELRPQMWTFILVIYPGECHRQVNYQSYLEIIYHLRRLWKPILKIHTGKVTIYYDSR